jgi:predicted ATPase
MSRAKLRAVEIEGFKSFEKATRVSFEPLTIILGRNNCGKSTLIQSLLLLKQTLVDPRPDVMLRLDGLIEAFNLRELTFGWPTVSTDLEGPVFTLEWESCVDVEAALQQAGHPEMENLIKHSKIQWLREQSHGNKILHTALKIWTSEFDGAAKISKIMLFSGESHDKLESVIEFKYVEKQWQCWWRKDKADTLEVDLEHFIPYLRIDRSKIGPRVRQRAWYNAYLILFAQPLEDLRSLLSELHYLGSSRQPPPSLYRPSTAAPSEIGVSGELAAQLLHRRQKDTVHFLPLIQLDNVMPHVPLTMPRTVLAKTMVDGVNEVMSELSINTKISVQDVQEVGFRLMFGEASLAHVGRGINSLLPLIELGLIADPLRFQDSVKDMPLDEYCKSCGTFAHIALEEPEAHLHPKVASHFAHWLVSLALSNRRLIVETHSDHLVRRLRGLAVRAGKGSELEIWLTKNVAIISVDQDADGRSSIKTSYLTAEGGVAEEWPTDFMDEATDEESAIYYAKLEKSEITDHEKTTVHFKDGPEPEPDEGL